MYIFILYTSFKLFLTIPQCDFLQWEERAREYWEKDAKDRRSPAQPRRLDVLLDPYPAAAPHHHSGGLTRGHEGEVGGHGAPAPHQGVAAPRTRQPSLCLCVCTLISCCAAASMLDALSITSSQIIAFGLIKTVCVNDTTEYLDCNHCLV